MIHQHCTSLNSTFYSGNKQKNFTPPSPLHNYVSLWEENRADSYRRSFGFGIIPMQYMRGTRRVSTIINSVYKGSHSPKVLQVEIDHEPLQVGYFRFISFFGEGF